MKHLIFLLVTLLTLSPCLKAQDTVLPPVIQEGLKALVDSNASDAVNIWLKGTPAERDGDLRGKLSSNLQNLRDILGKATGYEIVRQVQVSPSVVTTYIVIKYEQGPAFMISDTYLGSNGWTVANVSIAGVMRQIYTEDFIIDLYDQSQKK